MALLNQLRTLSVCQIRDQCLFSYWNAICNVQYSRVRCALSLRIVEFLFRLSVGGPVVCEAECGDESEKHTSQCHVNHSSNAVPVFSCPASAATDEVHSDARQIHVNECAYDTILYNITTFTVHTIDDVAQLICTVRYTAVKSSSVFHYEEQFVVLNRTNKTQPSHDGGLQCYFYFTDVLFTGLYIISAAAASHIGLTGSVAGRIWFFHSVIPPYFLQGECEMWPRFSTPTRLSAAIV